MIGEHVLAASGSRAAARRTLTPSSSTNVWSSPWGWLFAWVREWRLARGRAEPQVELAGAVRSTPDFVFSADKQGHLRYCNPAARRALGLGKSEDVSRVQLAEIYSAYSRTRVLGEGIMTAILDGTWSGEAALLTRAGTEIPVSLVIVAESAADGRPGFITLFARKRARCACEDTLRQASKAKK